MQYRGILQNPKFQEVKKAILERDGHKCQRCGHSEHQAIPAISQKHQFNGGHEM